MPAVTFRLGGVERLISVEDYRRAAHRRVPRLAWDFVEGGADDMVTVARNRDAFSRWALRARAMSGHRERPLGSTVAGSELALPVLLAPAGGSGLALARRRRGRAGGRSGRDAARPEHRLLVVDRGGRRGNAHRPLLPALPWRRAHHDADAARLARRLAGSVCHARR
jgi:FMN-dependent dehydrogenase